MSELLSQLERVLQMEDHLERMDEINDICCDATVLYDDGNIEESLPVLKRLHKIDEKEYDDLLQGAAGHAKEYLIKAGVIKIKTFEQVFGKEFKNPDMYKNQKWLIETAKEIYEKFPEDKEAIKAGFELSQKALEFGKLNKKQNRVAIIFKGLYERMH